MRTMSAQINLTVVYSRSARILEFASGVGFTWGDHRPRLDERPGNAGFRMNAGTQRRMELEDDQHLRVERIETNRALEFDHPSC